MGSVVNQKKRVVFFEKKKRVFFVFFERQKNVVFLFLLRNSNVKLKLMFSLKVKTNELKIRLLDIEKEILGGNMPILVPMYGKICKSSFTMEIGVPVNALGFKKSSTFQIKPKFVWSMLCL